MYFYDLNSDLVTMAEEKDLFQEVYGETSQTCAISLPKLIRI